MLLSEMHELLRNSFAHKDWICAWSREALGCRGLLDIVNLTLVRNISSIGKVVYVVNRSILLGV